MKRINFTVQRSISSRGSQFPLLSIGLLFLALNTSCNKDNRDTDDKAVQATADANMTLMNAVPNRGRQHVNVRSMGAAGDGITDDTKAFQKAIDAVAANGGGTVWVPPGDYSINADTSVFLKTNVTLSMADRARLIADTTSHERYAVIKAAKIHDAQILGGQIIGDRDYHIGTTGEHGYGISIQGCNNVQVKNTKISNCWGDGFIVSASGGTTSTNITVKGVVRKQPPPGHFSDRGRWFTN